MPTVADQGYTRINTLAEGAFGGHPDTVVAPAPIGNPEAVGWLELFRHAAGVLRRQVTLVTAPAQLRERAPLK